MQLPVRRCVGIRVNLLRPFDQPRPVCLSDRRGNFREWLQQRAFHRVRRNQVFHLFRHIPHGDLRGRITLLQALLHQIHVLIHYHRQSFQPCQNIFVVRHRLPRHHCQQRRRTLLYSVHLRNRYPDVPASAPRRSPVLQSFFGILQLLQIQVVVQLFVRRQLLAMELLHRRCALAHVFYPRLSPRRRIIRPTPVLSRKTHRGRIFRILLHPPLPVLRQKSSESSRLFVSRCVVCRLPYCYEWAHQRREHHRTNFRKNAAIHCCLQLTLDYAQFGGILLFYCSTLLLFYSSTLLLFYSSTLLLFSRHSLTLTHDRTDACLSLHCATLSTD